MMVIVALASVSSRGHAAAHGPDTANAHAGIRVGATVAASQASSVSPAGQSATIAGTLTMVFGDPQSGRGVDIAYVADNSGQTYRLDVSDSVAQAAGGLINLDRQQVEIRGIVVSAQAIGGSPMLGFIQVASLQRAAWASEAMVAGLTGQQKFVSILCRFSDSPGVSPQDVTYFNGLLGTAKPGINHFWRENSYQLINNDGSVVLDWVNLPHPRSYYVTSSVQGGANLKALAEDCTALGDGAVNFNDFAGVNLMFNDALDCCAWGGSQVLTLDGTTKAWPLTWMPPWAYETEGVLAHEMGHAYGLPHSSGPYGQIYDSDWDVMSAAGRFGTPDPTYGYVGVHTIAYHKDKLAWLGSRRYDAAANACATITIDYTSQVPATTGTYLAAKIPIGGATTRFYTVEGRKRFGYDSKLPGEAIIIHDVDTTRREPAHVVDGTLNDDPNDAGAMWLPGETYNDTANGIKIEVLAAKTNGWDVRITTGSGTCGTTGLTLLTLSLNKTSFVSFDFVTVTAAGNAVAGRASPVDAYLDLVDPFGGQYRINSALNISLPDTELGGVVAQGRISGIPAGTYQFTLVLVRPGGSPGNSSDWLSNRASVSFTFSPF